MIRGKDFYSETTFARNHQFLQKNHIKKLDVIHGIGDGVLQSMVLEVLRGETGLEYEDGTFFKHQSGTITVILK